MDDRHDALYKLGKTADPNFALCAAFMPSGRAGAWQMQICAQGRRKTQQIVLLETTALCPLATATFGSESFPLAIGWHERKRGGGLRFGGERPIGDGQLQWEMLWTPDPACFGQFHIELRVRTTPKRAGTLCLGLRAPLHAPQFWALASAAMHTHYAVSVRSDYSAWAVSLATLDGAGDWDSDSRQFRLHLPRFAFGGGKVVRLRIAFAPAPADVSPRAPLVTQYAALAGPRGYPLLALPIFNPVPAAGWLANPAHYAAPGAERLYLALPGMACAETVWAGAPHYPLDALKALSDWNGFHPNPDAARLVRGGAAGIATDFQVMGRGGKSQPNKGAFWDKRLPEGFTDEAGSASHGIASNARMARAFFLLHEANGDPLLRQSALNICQWLLLKMNDAGWYDGAHVHATTGSVLDGRFLPQSCALDGAEAIRPFVLAFRATRTEVFVKAAWKLANHLLERMAEFDPAAPPAIAVVVRALLALDAEAPNPRLRSAIGAWGAWLRTLPLAPDAPVFNADGRHCGLYDCAQAGFELFALTRDTNYYCYALAALQAVPETSRAQAWRELDAAQNALFALAALLPQSTVDFDRRTVSLEWRTFAPDPATDHSLQVQGDGGQSVYFLPLVCRATDQLLLLVLAPAEVQSIIVSKNKRQPFTRDLLSGTCDTTAHLHVLPGTDALRVGLLTVDP